MTERAGMNDTRVIPVYRSGRVWLSGGPAPRMPGSLRVPGEVRLTVCCPTCSAFQPSVEQEQAIRRSERALLLGAARAYVADARSAMLRAQASMPKGAAKTDLDRCINRLRTLLGEDETGEVAA